MRACVCACVRARGCLHACRGDNAVDAASRKAVLQTRIHHIDSVIVRVLKARRRIGHQALVAEVAKHLVVRGPRGLRSSTSLSPCARTCMRERARACACGDESVGHSRAPGQQLTTLHTTTNQPQARFKVQSSSIKKRIESLMEREYLRRDPADRSMYEYVA